MAASPGALEVVLNDPVARSYAKLVVSDDATTLLGGMLVGDASRYALLRPLVGSAAARRPGGDDRPDDGPGAGRLGRRARCPATRRSVPATR